VDSQELGQAFMQRVLPHLAADARESLVCAGPGSVWLRHRTLTLLSIAGPDVGVLPARLARKVDAELERLAERHGGVRDRFAAPAIVVFFADAADALRMALELQRITAVVKLRIGVDTAECVVAAAQVQGEMLVTLLGDTVGQAAQAARLAANGSVSVCASAYSRMRYAIEPETQDCLLAEEFDHDSQLAHVSITPAPPRAGSGSSTFAALGGL
jgi:hypothetical protein